MKILMVCLGNICRSPLAEGILKSKVNNEIFVDSAGTSAYHIGEKPDERSIAIAKKYQIDIKNQKARKFTAQDFDNFDTIYAMDTSNYKDIVALAKNEEEKNKVKFILNETFPNENLDVPDPYYGGESGFQNVFEILDKACTIIANNLNKNDNV